LRLLAPWVITILPAKIFRFSRNQYGRQFDGYIFSTVFACIFVIIHLHHADIEKSIKNGNGLLQSKQTIPV
ncbi:MAG: hypothetical protein FWF77_05165, partial [Defluviitaleaceae bacterium]|nr:hypothetical protein [Defluviitaleaceae bacterium]